MSAIQLERNGWKSSSKRTKHINLQYFYITASFKARDISRIIYKSTGDMVSDYFTKALQGKAFKTHWRTLMGLDGISKHLFYEKYKNYKTTVSDIVSIITPIHNKYKYKYK